MTNNKQGDTMKIFVTTGPGPKSGVVKTSVGTASTVVGGVWPTRHFTDTAKADGLVADLERQNPGAEVVHLTR
jgi:hypothetical protein